MEKLDAKLDESQLETFIEQHSEEAKQIISDEDNFEEFIRKLEQSLKRFPKLGEYLQDIATLVSLVRRYIKKEYTDVPMTTIVIIVATLLYLVNPFDLIPDVIPGIGLIDDTALLAWVLTLIHDDMEKYRKWRDYHKQEDVIV